MSGGRGTPLETDVLVVGAGLAGLHLATQLARRGHAVILADKRSDLTSSIRTTGIFCAGRSTTSRCPRTVSARRSGTSRCTHRASSGPCD